MQLNLRSNPFQRLKLSSAALSSGQHGAGQLAAIKLYGPYQHLVLGELDVWHFVVP